MRTRSRLAAPFAVALLACASPAVASMDPAPPAPLAPAPIFGDDAGDLVVNGEVIPEAAVRREMAYRLGMRFLETRKLEIFINRELEARGLKLVDMLEPGEVEAVVTQGRERIKEEYGGEISEEEVLRNNKLTLEDWRDQTRLTLIFNRLFLPDDPDEWPEITREAMKTAVPAEQNAMFLEKMKEGFEQRKAAGDIDNPNDQQRLMFNMLLRQPIVAALEGAAKIKTASDGIPAHVAMMVDDVEITTDEVFETIKGDLAPIEWERTRLWLAKNAAVRQALTKAGAFLDDEKFGEVWGALVDKYEESILPLEQLALAFKKFPSVDAYRLYRRGLESYRDLIADEINDDTLTEHLDRANRLMGLEQVDCEVILLSAYDFRLAEWKENGWKQAADRAIEVSRRLAAGENWDELLEEYSDYWDPPVPQSQQAQAQQQSQSRRNKGRFGLRNRNMLMPLVDESEYLVFLHGSSVADAIFFDQPAQSIGGPYRGAFGYYVARVNGRTPATKAYSVADPAQRESIEQDYVQTRFVEFAQKAIADAKITGL